MPKPPRPCDPVGIVEIAHRAGVARRTVDQWRQRYEDFPQPRWTVGGRPAWNWDDIEPWLSSRAVKLHTPTTSKDGG